MLVMFLGESEAPIDPTVMLMLINPLTLTMLNYFV